MKNNCSELVIHVSSYNYSCNLTEVIMIITLMNYEVCSIEHNQRWEGAPAPPQLRTSAAQDESH